MAYFSRTMAKIVSENFSSQKVKSITVCVCITDCTGDFYITDILLQGGPVVMGGSLGMEVDARWLSLSGLRKWSIRKRICA